MPTSIINWQLRSGDAHCDRELARRDQDEEEKDKEKEKEKQPLINLTTSPGR